MRLPSVKTLMRINIDKETAQRVRDCIAKNFGRYGADMVLAEVDKIIGGFGVEYVPSGSGSRSPGFDYINLGDTYKTTLVWINGNFRVTTWGDIVERGNYA